MLIKDVVTTCVAECTEDAPLAEVYDLIQKCEHGMVVVLDSTSHRVPLGIVDEHSICEQLISRGRRPKEMQAGSVMQTRVRRVPSSTPVEGCSEILRSGVSAPVLVVDERRRFCGMVTPRDLSAALLKTRTTPVVFAPAAAAPARTEIPAFGWLQ